ncbi:N-acetyltransferase family protein [Schumannella luteola]
MSERAAAEVVIRPARVEDARGVASVHVQAWREAYSRQLPPEFLESLDVEARVPRWAATIADDVTEVWVADVDGQVVGWASGGEGRDDDAPAPRELQAIYILQAFYGSGVGQRLIDAALGTQPAYLWILEDNPRAAAFYRRNGFERDGAERDQLMGGIEVHVVRMVRRAAV